MTTPQDPHTQLHLLVDTLSPETAVLATTALQTLHAQEHTPLGGFTRLLGLHFTLLQEGQCEASLEVKPHLLNQLGIAHGGVPYSLVDTVCGWAAIMRLGEGGRVVTQDLHYRYHGPAKLGHLRATAEVIHHGTRTIVTQGRVYQGETLIGSATATFAIL